jgi:TonB family protein
LSIGLNWIDDRRDREISVRFRRFIAGSAVAHVLALALILIAGHFSSQPRFDQNTIVVSFHSRAGHPQKDEPGPPPPAAPRPKPPAPALAPPPVPAPEPPQQPPKKEEPKPKPEAKPEAKPEPKPAPAPIAKEVSPDKGKTDPKPSPKKPEAPARKPEPVSEPKKTPEPQAEPSAPPLPPDKQNDIELARSLIHGKAGDGSGPGGGGDWEDGVEGYEGDETMGAYLNEDVAEVIVDLWRIPLSVPPGTDLSVDVIIKIDNGGKVLESKIVRRSDHPDLDRSVLTLLQDLKALPPPPRPSKEGFFLLKIRLRPGDEA